MSYIKTYYKSKNGTEKLSTNFLVKEFACKDGSDKILIDKEMIYILQEIRNILGPITINSAYRTDVYNKKVGGATNSYHKKGQAFDIVDRNKNLTAICNIANSLGVKGIIRYSTFVHIDSRATKYHASSAGARLTYSKHTIPFIETTQKRSKGLAVALIQFKLKSLGYTTGIVDADAGSKFDSCVRQYQKDKGLTIDGIVGKVTWNKLFNS